MRTTRSERWLFPNKSAMQEINRKISPASFL
ncbi:MULTISPECIES: hypothetical protein [unclassified Paenibacillus]